ncbi:cytoplasmic protein [Salmonella enterica]|nr:cytoplasmic protein [Salmonella enterica]
MRISEQVLLCVLRQGGCIRSFWRRSARLAGTPAPVVPDGLVLETPGERGDTLLSHVDFAVVAKSLACSDEWSQVAGATEFGGAVWRMAPDTDAQEQGNGERDEQ